MRIPAKFIALGTKRGVYVVEYGVFFYNPRGVCARGGSDGGIRATNILMMRVLCWMHGAVANDLKRRSDDPNRDGLSYGIYAHILLLKHMYDIIL